MIEVEYKMQLRDKLGMNVVDDHTFEFQVEQISDLTEQDHQGICNFLMELYMQQGMVVFEEGILNQDFKKFYYEENGQTIDLTYMIQRSLDKIKNT